MHAYRESWRLAWPLILSNLSVPLLGLVDTAVVGHLPIAATISGAVALGADVLSVLYFMFGFLRMGTTALTAQAFGAGDSVELRAKLVRGAARRGRPRPAGHRGGAAGDGARRPAVRPRARGPDEFRRYLGDPAARRAGSARQLRAARLAARAAGFAPAAAADAGHQRHQRRPWRCCSCSASAWPRRAWRLATVIAEYAGFGAGPGHPRRRRWRRQGGWPGWPAVMVAARFRRLLRVNRDLFLRSLMLEAAFLVFTAIGSRHGS